MRHAQQASRKSRNSVRSLGGLASLSPMWRTTVPNRSGPWPPAAGCWIMPDPSRHCWTGWLKSGRLPINELAAGSGVDKKTLERHRKYLVAILLAFTNGYEIIRGHLCQLAPAKEGGAK